MLSALAAARVRPARPSAVRLAVEIKTALGVIAVLALMGVTAMATRPRPSNEATIASLSTAPARIARRGDAPLIIPVDGVDRSDLVDTWGDARGEGRTHKGVDIMAPHGAPVRAAVSGHIEKLTRSGRGGLSIYLRDARGELIYAYNHLQGYEERLREGDKVVQGQLIGFVGSTGNATAPHLHFEIQRTARGRWSGEAINPYPALRSGRPPRP